MPRETRKESGTGIYHVMMRGINRQDIFEEQEDIGATIKHLAVMYALYFNRKYSRAGHLFQDRFKSEPVRSSSARLLPTGRKNDMAYFTVLLRYIHQNPVKAGLVERIGDYQWSSWGEYTGDVPKALGLCATNVVLKRMPLEDLRGLVEDPLADDVCILDIDDTPRITIGDRDVRHLLETAYGIRMQSRCKSWIRTNETIYSLPV